MGLFGDILKRARLRSLADGPIQNVRAEVHDNKAHDEAQRFNDYGFKSNPVDGQGLILTVAGLTIVLRMDRLAESPALAAHEVTIWHKEGHSVTLRAGKVIDVNCDVLNIAAAQAVNITTQAVRINSASLQHNNINVGSTHVHPQNNGSHFGGGVNTSSPQ